MWLFRNFCVSAQRCTPTPGSVSVLRRGKCSTVILTKLSPVQICMFVHVYIIYYLRCRYNVCSCHPLLHTSFLFVLLRIRGRSLVDPISVFTVCRRPFVSSSRSLPVSSNGNSCTKVFFSLSADWVFFPIFFWRWAPKYLRIVQYISRATLTDYVSTLTLLSSRLYGTDFQCFSSVKLSPTFVVSSFFRGTCGLNEASSSYINQLREEWI